MKHIRKMIVCVLVAMTVTMALAGCGEKKKCDFCGEMKNCKTISVFGEEINVCGDCIHEVQ